MNLMASDIIALIALLLSVFSIWFTIKQSTPKIRIIIKRSSIIEIDEVLYPNIWFSIYNLRAIPVTINSIALNLDKSYEVIKPLEKSIVPYSKCDFFIGSNETKSYMEYIKPIIKNRTKIKSDIGIDEEIKFDNILDTNLVAPEGFFVPKSVRELFYKRYGKRGYFPIIIETSYKSYKENIKFSEIKKINCITRQST